MVTVNFNTMFFNKSWFVEQMQSNVIGNLQNRYNEFKNTVFKNFWDIAKGTLGRK